MILQNSTASGTPFDPAGTTLTSTTVQAAIVEVNNNITGSVPPHASTHLPNGTDPLTTAAPVTLNPDVANTIGTANAFARADHIHNVPADVVVNTSTSNTEGTSTSFARADHTHNTTIANQSVTDTATLNNTSNTPVVVTGMTLTVSVAGTYLVMSNLVWVANGNNVTTVALYKAGTIITGIQQAVLKTQQT
jgi:hypothetical protein